MLFRLYIEIKSKTAKAQNMEDSNKRISLQGSYTFKSNTIGNMHVMVAIESRM